MQGRLSFFIQMLPRGKFWLEVADEKLTSSIMRTFCLCVCVLRVDMLHIHVGAFWWLVMASQPVNATGGREREGFKCRQNTTLQQFLHQTRHLDGYPNDL